MRPTRQAAPKWLKAYTIRTFQRSGRKSLLITGAKGAGKSTLLEELIDGASVPGVVSEVERGADGLPARVWLRERGGGRRCLIGVRDTGAMRPCKEAFDAGGAALLHAVRHAPGAWAAVDEIGFLEACSPSYLAELRMLFEQKRVLAAVRKDGTPFLQELFARSDCFVLDLDGVEEEA